MSKLFKITFILSAFIVATCQAASDGLYTSVQLGEAGAVLAGNGVYGRLLLGEQVNRFFAFETGATLVPHTNSGGGWIHGEAGKAYTMDGDVKLMLPLGSRFNLYAKAGPSVGYVEADTAGMALLANASAGMNVDLTKHISTDLSVGALFGQRDFADAFIGLGMSYHFA